MNKTLRLLDSLNAEEKKELLRFIQFRAPGKKKVQVLLSQLIEQSDIAGGNSSLGEVGLRNISEQSHCRRYDLRSDPKETRSDASSNVGQ